MRRFAVLNSQHAGRAATVMTGSRSSDDEREKLTDRPAGVRGAGPGPWYAGQQRDVLDAD